MPNVLGGRPKPGCHVWKVRFFPRVYWLTRKDSVEEVVSEKLSKEGK